MCGITGFISDKRANQSELSGIIQKMNECLTHRGPDAEGKWINERKGIALGHRRLSIIDLSEAGRQPMVSQNGRYVIVYNGEIYNYRDIKKSLKSKNVQLNFRGHSDTEIFLEATACWGLEEALKMANGMFALALWDKQEEKLSLARDRFGKKPLYFGWNGNQFIFSSELKSIMASPGFSNDISPKSLFHYLNYKNIPTPLSIFHGIYKLPAGTYIDFAYSELNKLPGWSKIKEKIIPFWKLANSVNQKSEKTDLSFAGACSKFRTLLRDSVDKRMISDVPLGAFLSGGIDSSLVVSVMQEVSQLPVKTFTIGFNDDDYDEASTAKSIADTLGTEHTEHYIEEKNAYSIVPELASVYDEPFADASQIPTMLVSRLAKRDVTVVLSGDGGDELMGGYSRHLFANKLWKYSKNIPLALRSMIPATRLANYENVIQKIYDRFSKNGFINKNHRQFANKVIKTVTALSAGSQEELYAGILKNKLNEQKLLQNTVIKAHGKDTAFDFEGVDDTLNMLEKMMFWDVKNYMMDDVLVKVDRASMSASLEARSPLLDYRLFEYVWSLPTKYLVSNKTGGKLLMKALLKEYLPGEILNQPKSGFTIPIGQWLKGPLNNWAGNLIDSPNGGYHYINKGYVQSIWQKHLQGIGNWQEELWTVLMFLQWHNTYL